MIMIIPATPTVVPAGMFPDFPDCSFLSAQKSLEKKIENKQHRSDNDDDDYNKNKAKMMMTLCDGASGQQ